MSKAETLVFVGPSLPPADRVLFPDITFLPPIAQGDLFAKITPQVGRVGIIDGFFGDRLSIFHKEILWAIAQGVEVVGGASMGALRAAELDSFGMVGVGEIYRGYTTNVFVSDADVAVAHAPQDLGYGATSVAIVDVNATLEALVKRDRLPRQVAQDLLKRARDIHFRDRTWEALAKAGQSDFMATNALRDLLAGAHIQRKRLDALEVIAWLQSKPASKAECPPGFAPPLTGVMRKMLSRAGLSAIPKDA